MKIRRVVRWWSSERDQKTIPVPVTLPPAGGALHFPVLTYWRPLTTQWDDFICIYSFIIHTHSILVTKCVDLSSCVCVCLGTQRTELSLLGSVWWSRRFWCRCVCFQVPSSSRRGAASGGAGDPSESFPTAAHLSGRGAHPPPPPPRRGLLAARSVQSRVSPGGGGGSGLS